MANRESRNGAQYKAVPLVVRKMAESEVSLMIGVYVNDIIVSGSRVRVMSYLVS